MLVSHQAYYKNGKIMLPKEIKIPEGSEILVTIIEKPSDDFFKKASEKSLDNIWNNKEDDVYEQLLKK
ncbi:MAG: antitoxin AF2212-like protein [FCB group bacterium]|jgi:uncharacterized Zn finger protein